MLIIRLKSANPWHDIIESERATIGHAPITANDKIPQPKDLYRFYVRHFIASHSTIRSVGFRIIDTTARKDVTRQILRATKGHPQPYVQSSRPDWTGKARDESVTATNIFIHDHTAESWMELAKQRLCFRAMKETREWCMMVVRAMYEHDDPFFKALAYCSVPSCVFQAGCPEGATNCGWYARTFGSGLAAYGLMTRRTVYKELFEHGLIEGIDTSK